MLQDCKKLFIVVDLPNDEYYPQEKIMRFKIRQIEDVCMVAGMIEDCLLSEAGKPALCDVVSPHPPMDVNVFAEDDSEV